MKRLLSLSKLPTAHQEPERVKNLTGLVLALTAAGLALYLLTAIFGRLYGPGRLVVPLLAFPVIVFLDILRRRGRIQVAAWGLVVLLFLLTSYWIYRSGGVEAPGYGGLLVIVLIAGALLGFKVGLVVAALAVLYGAFLLAAQTYGILPEPVQKLPSFTFFFFQAAATIISATVVYLSTRSIRELLQSYLIEVREHERSEQALSASEERFIHVIQSLPMGIHMYRLEPGDRLVFTGANPAADHILGLDHSLLVGKTIEEVFPPLILTEVPEQYREVCRSGKAWKTEQIAYEDKRIKGVFEVNAFPTQPGCMATVFTDITKRRLAEEQLLNIAKGVSAVVGDSFFHSLTEHLSHGLNADCAFVGELVGLEQPRIRTIAVYRDGQEQNDFEYLLKGTPCETVVGKKICCYPEGVQELFPSDQSLVRMNIHGYAAAPLFASDNRSLGLLTVLFRKPITDQAYVTNMLQIFAVRASAEMERRQTEKQIARHLSNLESLRTIDLAIVSNMEMGAMLAVLLDQVNTQLAVDASCLMLYNPGQHNLHCAGVYGLPLQVTEKQVFALEDCLAGEVITTRRPLQIQNLQKAERLQKLPVSRDLVGSDYSTYFGVPLIAKNQVIGVLEVYMRTPLEPTREWRDFLEMLAGQAAVAIDNVHLFNDVQRANSELILAYDSTLEGWAKALELRNKETEGHSRRVTSMTVQLASELGFSGDDLAHVRRGALLHDIGKMGIPDNILNKPGKLSPEEWQIMRMHPVYAYDVLQGIPFLKPSLDIPFCHHEKWDGSGYPRGLKGSKIPLSARIFCIIDVWDALLSERPYRPAWETKQVLEYLRQESGKHFDPEIVDCFLALLDRDG